MSSSLSSSLSGGRRRWVKATLLLSGLDALVASAMIVPIMADIHSAFPDAGPWVDQLIALPSLLMLPALVIAGKLSDYISKKWIQIFGQTMFFIGGITGIFANNIMTLLITRCILGIGSGIQLPLIPSYVAHLFEERERVQMMGWINAAGCIASFILSILAGYIALLNWRYTFLVYSFYAIIIALQFIFLPYFPPEKKDPELVQSMTKSARINLPVSLNAAGMFIFMSFGLAYIYKLAVFIQAENLGTSAHAGLATSLNTVFSFVISALFFVIFGALGRYTSLASVILMGLCYYLLSIADSYLLVVLASICFGASLGMMMPFMNTRVTTFAPKAGRTLCLTLLSFGIYLGQFFASYCLQFIENFTQGDLRATFTTLAIIFLAFAVFVVIFINATRKEEERWLKAGPSQSFLKPAG